MSTTHSFSDGTKYHGSNPVYVDVSPVGKPAVFAKTGKGSPFIRVTDRAYVIRKKLKKG